MIDQVALAMFWMTLSGVSVAVPTGHLVDLNRDRNPDTQVAVTTVLWP